MNGLNELIKRLVLLALVGFVAALAMPSNAAAQEKMKMTATYQIEKGKRQGWLILKVKIPEGNHIYALTQEGSPPPTKLKLAKSENFKLLKKFASKEKPKIVEKDPIFENRIEKHLGEVTFLAPIEVADGADLENVEFDLKFHGQMCNESGCVPMFNKPVEVKFAGFYEAPQKKKTGSGSKSSSKGSGSK